jgi:tRNA dimethylallyltransferase
MPNEPKIIAIVGQTATGKSDLAIAVAKYFHGAVISADSRQVYRGMDIGTGKVKTKLAIFPELSSDPIESVENIPHFGINLVDPNDNFTVSDFKTYAEHKIRLLLANNYLPIICGGTGLWIDTLLNNQSIPKAPASQEIRTQLETKSTEALVNQLVEIDPDRAKSIDKKNRARLIRAIEINLLTGKPVPKITTSSDYEVLYLAVLLDKKELEEKIKSRLKERLDTGMLNEVKQLHKKQISYKRFEELGLEYKYCSLVLQNKLPESQLFSKLSTKIFQYAKRQQTWFKRNKNIHYIKNYKEATQLIKNFLT